MCSHTVFPTPFPTALEQALYPDGPAYPVSKKYIPFFIFQTWKIPNTYKGINNRPRKPHVPLTQLPQLSTHITPMPRIVLKQALDASFHPQVFQYYMLSSCTPLLRPFLSTHFVFPNSISSCKAQLRSQFLRSFPLNLSLSHVSLDISLTAILLFLIS